MNVNGMCSKEFEAVKDAFKLNFDMYEEIGASLCVYHNGQEVVNIWAGHKDLNKTHLWTEDTVVPMFSTSKLVSSLCLALCHSRGLFSYKDPVAKYWPEFATKGKENITIEQLLHHRGGLSIIDKKLDIETLSNYDLLDSILAQQKPAWNPGDFQGYHSWTIGWYISALLSRIDPNKRRIKDFVIEEFMPHIKGDIRIGIEKDYPLDKIAILDPFSKARGMRNMKFKFVRQFFMPWSITFRTMLNPSFVGNHGNFNNKEVLELDFGSGGGIANSIGLASLLHLMMNDKESPIYLDPKTQSILLSYPNPPKVSSEDIVLKEEGFTFSYGVMKPNKQHNFSANQSAFGGFGAGGSFAFADPENQLIVAYTMNKMGEDMMNGKREVNIRDAVYQSIKNTDE